VAVTTWLQFEGGQDIINSRKKIS